MKKCLSIEYWKRRRDALFDKADAMGDTLDAPLSIFKKQRRLYFEATLISMIIDSLECELRKAGVLC